MAFFGAIAVQNTAEVSFLTRDPAAAFPSPWYVGMASSIGVTGWSVGATLFLLGAFLQWHAEHPYFVMLAGGVLTSVLWFDDLFLVHERILDAVFNSEKPILLAYAIAVPGWLWLSRKDIRPPSLVLALAAGIGLASSVAVEVLFDSESDAGILAEEGLKFAGIWLWAAFAASMLLAALPAAEPDADR